MAPFKECKITPGWETSGYFQRKHLKKYREVASTFNIYPAPKSALMKKAQALAEAKAVARKVPALQKTMMKPKILQEKKKPTAQDEVKKIDVKESSGVPKLTIEVIRKRYLYPFSIDSIFL